MALLTPDKTSTINGVTVNEFLLTKHNPNKIAMPTASMNYAGVTIHNTDDLANVHDDAEQYTRATYNGNMNDVRVHFYVDDVCAWQNLPLTLQGWHASDSKGKGNTTTVAIECIMKNNTDKENEKAEDNAARLAAYLLHQKGLNIGKLYTHTHWLNVRDGKWGSVDYLNTAKHPYKMCPAYILPHWDKFKAKVQSYLNQLKKTTTTAPKPSATTTETTKTFKAKDTVKLNKTPLYVSSIATVKSTTKTGTFYVYDSKITNKRIRITTKASYCGKAGKVTGWVNVSDITGGTKTTVNYFKACTYKGPSFVDALKSIGVSTTISYRTKIAKANGITLYLLLPNQNTKLLNLLKKGKLIKP